MNFADLESYLLMSTFEYTRPPSIQFLRLVCRRFRITLDNRNNVVWKDLLQTHSTPLVNKRLLFGNSLGTTALLVKASVVRDECVSCRLWFNLVRNPLYDLLVCKRCSKKANFRVVSLKKACMNYFLDYKAQTANESLVRFRKGNSLQVVWMHVRAIAFSEYPNGELDNKIGARFAKAYKTEIRRHGAKEKRIRDIAYSFLDVLWQSPARVDQILRNQELVKDLVYSFGSKEDVFGDVLEHRVRSAMKTTTVAKRLYDYAAMLTYMRKLQLLDFRYTVTAGHRCNPYNIYRHHVNEGLHFYEIARHHADAMEEFKGRILAVEVYMLKKDPTKLQRKSLAVAMCAENKVDYDAEFFKDFVENKRGNPAELSRKLREKQFLNQNHLAWERNNFLLRGYSLQAAEMLGEKNVLHRTKGYPAMMRFLTVQLS